MEILILVSHAGSGPLVAGLAGACIRRGITWGTFFTHDGVCVLNDAEFAALMTKASEAHVCRESWVRHMGGASCPVTLGSQTNNSAMMAAAHRVISL